MGISGSQNGEGAVTHVGRRRSGRDVIARCSPSLTDGGKKALTAAAPLGARAASVSEAHAGTSRGTGLRTIAKARHIQALAAFLMPASAAKSSALSVRSHVNSGSLRPKWPYAAVFV